MKLSIKMFVIQNDEMKFLRFNGTKEFKTENENNVIYRFKLTLKFFCRVLCNNLNFHIERMFTQKKKKIYSHGCTQIIVLYYFNSIKKNFLQHFSTMAIIQILIGNIDLF